MPVKSSDDMLDVKGPGQLAPFDLGSQIYTARPIAN